MSNKASDSKPIFTPADQVPLPPPDADVITTCCDYCIVACGYKVYRWPADGPDGGPKRKENALGLNYPLRPGQGGWVGPNQFTQANWKGKLHNIAVVPDHKARAVNVGGGHSIRGGCIAQKVYNPNNESKDRLQKPMVRINGKLTPVSWDFALDVAAQVGKHVIRKHGESAWAMKYFSYQYLENTYALTKLALKAINSPAVSHHDHPSFVNSVPGWVDIGYDIFGAAYEDFAKADCLLISGTDPFETKTVVWNTWILKGISGNNTKVIMVNPRKTAGAAYVEQHGGLHLDINPGSDTVVHMAIARVIVENGWHDSDFIRDHVANQWETDSGFGQGTRNTPWQWRTTWGKFQVKGFEGSEKHWKEWLLSQKESDPEVAAKIAGIDVAKIYKAAELMGKPQANGQRTKTSILIEKGNYWSNNYLNTASIGNLGAILGIGGKPGQVMTRLGGHQRGGQNGGKYPRWKSPYKVPGRRRHALDLDRWLQDGQVRYAYVVGTTWIQAMAGSSELENAIKRFTTDNPHQVTSSDKQAVIDTLIKRVDSGGMAIVNQEIYLRDPIGEKYADVVLPASGWGEEDLTRANGERRIRLYGKFYDAPGEALPDWKIAAMLAKKMGFMGFDWKDSNEVFNESCRFSRGGRKDYNAIKIMAKKQGVKPHEYLRSKGTTGLQTPLLVFDGKLVQTKRLHDYNRKDIPDTGPEKFTVTNKRLLAFKTQTGKLNMVKTPWNLWSDFYDYMQPKGDELWVTNGRINEIWQSGFDDQERRAYIRQRWPENFIEINPVDAQARGIESGDRVKIWSDRVPVVTSNNLGVKSDDMWFSGLMKDGHIMKAKGEFDAVAIVTPAVKQGVAFTEFLTMKQAGNNITPRVPDPVSQNYRFKIASGKIKKIGESPYKDSFAEMSFKRRDIV